MICTRIGVLSSFRKTIDNVGDITVDNNSTDIIITGVSINSIPITYSTGTDFPISAGVAQGDFTTTQLGTYTVVITYNFVTAGQSLLFIDSNSNSTCHNAGSGTFTVNNAIINAIINVGIFANTGVCF